MFKMKVRDYQVGGRHFVLGVLEGRFVAIEDKYIDDKGCCTERLNGIQMYASRTLQECMQRVSDQVQVDALIASGMEPLEAIKQVLL